MRTRETRPAPSFPRLSYRDRRYVDVLADHHPALVMAALAITVEGTRVTLQLRHAQSVYDVDLHSSSATLISNEVDPELSNEE